ncbi:MAG TPA: zinc ribbon domain-containing protein [Spirochaetia bacterium]|nr:zinc ribbon domain-containing protein [Spirochaetia bacterium]
MARQQTPRDKARFFCEQCGAEVRAGASSCPSCGSVFTAVRCPECGYEGRAPEFKAGCPVCGYAAMGAPPAGPDLSASSGARDWARSPAAPLPRRRGMPVLASRIALVVLSLLVVGLVLYIVLHG